jgi:hypothetical protein
MWPRIESTTKAAVVGQKTNEFAANLSGCTGYQNFALADGHVKTPKEGN